MPVKFPKGFGRRRSTATPFEDGSDAPAVEQSFKVFERPESGSKSFDGKPKLTKAAITTPPPQPIGRTRAVQLEEDNMFENVGKYRGSGASNTNTASTTDNSSRLSGASTAPSSTDIPHQDRRSNDKPHEINIPPVPRSTSAFSLKNAGRTLSWGRHKHPSMHSPKESISHTIEEGQTWRERAVTASSYASTATPPKLEQNNDLGLNLGGDFSDMFSGFGNRRSVVMDAESNRSTSNSPDAYPAGPASRQYPTSRGNGPSPLSLDPNKYVEPSPYSWSSQNSREGLMSSVSPPPQRDTPPPVPQHSAVYGNQESQSYSRQKRPSASDNGLRRSSANAPRKQSTLEYGDSVDEDARLLKDSVNASRHLESPSYSPRVRDSWALPSDSIEEAPVSNWRMASTETTPRAKKAEPVIDEENMFDSQTRASATTAQQFQDTQQRFSDRSWSTAPKRNAKAPATKVMTPAQFERAKQDQERLKSVGGQSKDEQDDDDEEIYEDDEDEAEKAKQLAKQRRKQEAHMAVYRQQMMKVTGEAPSTSRPQVFATQSSPNLTVAASSNEDPEEDEEVPLAILQAHGFPSKSKPQIRSMGSNPNLRGSGSISGGVVGSGNLPVFARNLPQDPYYGAGIVTPAHRESMSFGGGSGSVTGVAPRGLPPGGLVGVIATEERSRAMRRGSPNPEGTYGPPPSNGFNGMGMGMQPPAPGSMYNGMGPAGQMPMGPMGPMQPMMLSPGDAAQIQMSQQMSQFMQMQMQFMQIMTQSGQQQQVQNGHMSHASMVDVPRPSSAQGLRSGSTPQHQRAMTMLEPNAVPWMHHNSMYAPSVHAQGNGYAPSIAPSERSNIGLPNRYRPVSQAPPVKDLRTSTMSGALQNWENENGGATIKAVKKLENVSDEDDEEGWEEMAKKREKKKSIWRIKKDKDPNGLKEILSFAQ